MPVSINGQTGAVTGLAALPDSAMSSGSIIQVKQAFKTDAASTTSTSFTDISGLSVSITASSASNKFLITSNISASCDSNIDAFLILLKDSTEIASGTGGSVENMFALIRETDDRIVDSFALNFLDTAGDTNAHTYKIQFRTSNSSNPLVINRRNHDAAFGLPSSITVMEVAA